jgi:zinc protease
MRGALRLLALLAVVLPSSAHAGVFFPETFTLDNGLQIIVVPNHLAPAVTQMVWYKVGSTYEVAPKTGLAHYLEHLMFRGTSTTAPGSFSKTVAAQGGSDNAFTSYDYTSFHETVASDRLAMVMQMEADRMQNLQIKPETATPELSVVLNERQERTDNSPEGRFGEKMRHALMPNYPYGVPVIGWKPEIEKLTAADANDFYMHHYAPNNAVVVISGDVTLEQVKKLATDIYGKVPRRDVLAPPPIPPLTEPTEHRVVVVDAGVEQAQVEFQYVVPSYSTQRGTEAYAYEVLAETLDGGEVGALYRDLVMKQGIAAGTDTSFDPDTRGGATFTLALVPPPEKDAEALEKATRAELAKLAADGLPADAIEFAKKRLIRTATFARDGLMAPGYVFGEAVTTGHKVEDVEAWPDRIKAVTPQQVNDALKALVADKFAITGLLLPDKNATPATKAAARKPSLSHDESIR